MKKSRKLLALVLSLAMVLSVVVLPMSTAQATAGDVIAESNFDTETDVTVVFGSQATDKVEYVTDAEVSYDLALEENDKVAHMMGGSSGALGTDNSFMFGKNWGDSATGITHATLQFELYCHNTWNQFAVLPTARDRYGMKMVAGATGEIKALEGGWTETTPDTATTTARYTWKEYAIEYKIADSTLNAKMYIDGILVDTYTAPAAGTAVPFDFNIQGTSTSSGDMYLNNLVYYEGAYGSYTAPTPAPTNAPSLETVTRIEDFNFNDGTTSWSNDTNWEFADGDVAKLAKNDKIVSITGENFLKDYANHTFYSQKRATVTFGIYTTSVWNSFYVRPQTFWKETR